MTLNSLTHVETIKKHISFMEEQLETSKLTAAARAKIELELEYARKDLELAEKKNAD